MEIVEKKKLAYIAALFAGWNNTLIWSCLQGHMGYAWADTLSNPSSAQIIVGDFCFFAGTPNIDLVQNFPADFHSDFLLMIPQNDGWSAMIEQLYASDCEKVFRYSIKKESDIFDREKLRSYIEKLPPEYRLKMIGEALFHQSKAESWSCDLCSQFTHYDDYRTHGIGFMVLHGEIPVSGASSYAFYDKGIEIEVDTKREFRNRGLALACASELILECLDRGLYPSWDAHDLRSVVLAEKLGYHLDQEYVTYIIQNNR
jgi:GNAT superfamily N-acetyltransferase